MKTNLLRYPIFVLTFITVSAITSCRDNSIISNSADMALSSIKMSAPNFMYENSEKSRSNLAPSKDETSFSWQKGDIVAVYSYLKGLTNFYIDDESISEDGTTAEFNGSGFTLSNNNTYYAFYPYCSSIQTLDKKSIPITYSEQEISANGSYSNLGKFDYMYARGITNNNGKVALSFNHLGCVAKFNLTVPKSANYTIFKVESKEGDKLLSSGRVDLTSESPTINLDSKGDSAINVKLNSKDGGIFVEKDSLLTICIMMPSQNLDGIKLNLHLYDSNNNRYTASIYGKNMQAGYTYNYKTDEENGNFTGSGTGLPNDDNTPELISTFNNPQAHGYEGMLLDGNILYTSGFFGVQSINYSDKSSPKLENRLSISTLTNGRNDMLARSIAQKDQFLYVPLRQNSSGSMENYTPQYKFQFESIVGDYSSNQEGITNNNNLNNFFEDINITSINTRQNFKVIYIYQGYYQNGSYINTINIQGENGQNCVLFRETFSNQNEALSSLKNEYRNDKGDYCKVNWSKLSIGHNVFTNIKFNLLGEFDAYKHNNASIIGEDAPCPNTGIYSICLQTEVSDKEKQAILIHNLNDNLSIGDFSFWYKIDNMTSEDIIVPLANYQSTNVLSLIIQSVDSEKIKIGLLLNKEIVMGNAILNKKEWYNIKISLREQSVNLYYRPQEAGSWNNIAYITPSSIPIFNQLAIGINTYENNAKMYIDDYYFDETAIDDLSYINGKLAIIEKSTLKVKNIYNLDVKCIDAKVYENRLIVTCFYGFNVYDISNPASPKLTYAYRINNFKESQNCDIFEYNGQVYLFICNYSQGYIIANITDVNNVSITKIDEYKNITYNGENLYNKIYNFDVCISYPFAYLTNSTTRSYLNSNYDRRGVLTLNLNDFNNPNPIFTFIPNEVVTEITTGDPQPTRIARYNNKLILNNAEKGLLIFDIGIDGIPQFSYSIKTPENSCINCIYVNSDYIFVADKNIYPFSNIYLFKGI